MPAHLSLSRLLGPRKLVHGPSEITLRYARPDDIPALVRLAALDSSPALQGLVLLAEVAGEPWAAMSLKDGRAIADPFHPTAEIVFLLAERARQLTSEPEPTRSTLSPTTLRPA